MKNTLPAWMARCLLACGLAGGPLGLPAQSNIEVTPTYRLVPAANGNYTLNLAVNLNTLDAVVQAEHYPEGIFQANYATTRTTSRYNATIPIPGQNLNQGLIRAYSNNAAATTFAADFFYTIVTEATLRNYPKVTDRMGRVSFTPSAADRLNPYPNGGFLQRLMIVSADYAPLLRDIPRGWRPVSDLVSVAAATGAGAVSNFQQNGLLEIGYQDWGLEPAEELTLSLFRWNEGSLVWEKLACPRADTLLDRLSVNIALTGTYALLSMGSTYHAINYVAPGQQYTEVAATSLSTTTLVDSLGVLLARGGTEIILEDGFAAFRHSQFDTQLTGSYCVSATGPGSTAREGLAGGAETPPGLSSPETAAAQPLEQRAARVHPNPAGAAFTLTYRVRDDREGPLGNPNAPPGPQPVTIRLYDMRGRLMATILSGSLKAPGLHAQTVPAAALLPALYVLELRVGNEPKRTFKVIKQ